MLEKDTDNQEKTTSNQDNLGGTIEIGGVQMPTPPVDKLNQDTPLTAPNSTSETTFDNEDTTDTPGTKTASEQAKDTRPFLVVRRFKPEELADPNWVPDPETTEGIVLLLRKDGKLDPAMVPEFIMCMDVAKLADGRTTIVSARTRNNFLIVESVSVNEAGDYNQEEAVEVCRQRILNRLWDYLQFTLAMGTVCNRQIKSEFEMLNMTPSDSDKPGIIVH